MILVALDRLQIKTNGNVLGLYPKEIINIVVKDLCHFISGVIVKTDQVGSMLNKG